MRYQSICQSYPENAANKKPNDNLLVTVQPSCILFTAETAKIAEVINYFCWVKFPILLAKQKFMFLLVNLYSQRAPRALW